MAVGARIIAVSLRRFLCHVMGLVHGLQGTYLYWTRTA